ncbi:MULTISPECIES: carboxymuconolactone decarboxylase family protein [Salinibaculum]|uniref:carboxymuconolactone decarboxylase family protein n=1 Tax=Salinibaculum TaxID=2732368 RepID=UPI0030D59A12
MDAREYTHDGIEEFFDSDLAYAAKYDALAGHVIRSDDGLSRKTRELILIALACAEDKVDPCADHIRDALNHGATDDEVVKTIQLAGLAGSAWGIKTGSEALKRVRNEQ